MIVEWLDTSKLTNQWNMLELKSIKPRKWVAIGPYEPTKFVILGGEDLNGEELTSDYCSI